MSPETPRVRKAPHPASAPPLVDTPADPAAVAALEEIVINQELTRRAARPPDYQAENAALVALARAMARAPDTLFHLLVEAAQRLCHAQSAGLSLLEEDGPRPVFRWQATTGVLHRFERQTMPRHDSPCGVVLDRDGLVLLREPHRRYAYLRKLVEPVQEVLLAPLHRGGRPVGTVWVVAHDTGRQFDAEDARIVSSLAEFASAAWEAREVRAEARATQQALRAQEQEQQQSRQELADTREQARQTQARFAAFFDQSPFYAGILACDGTVLEASRMALQGCGYAREEVLGRPFWETGWWRGSRELQQQIREAVTAAVAGRRFHAELPYQFADGTARVAEVNLSPVYAEDGTLSFLIATGVDITERAVAERELEVARRRLDSALMAAELGVYEWDVVADRLYGDQNFARLFQVPLDEQGSAPLDHYLAMLHPADRDHVAAEIARSVRTGDNFQADYRVILPGGERWINSRGRMVKDAAGNVVKWFGVALDITARKQVEQAHEATTVELRRLAAIHETVLSATDDFAYIFDRQGRFLYANRRLLEVWAKSLDQIVGKTCYELGYPTWHADMHTREIAQVIATRQPIRGEVPFTGDSGIHGIYDYIFAPVFGPDGEVELVAGTTRDVTARRRTEDRDRFLVTLDDATRPLTEPEAITSTSARLLGQHLQVNRCAYADVEADENTFNLTGNYRHGVPSIVGRYRFDAFGEQCLEHMRRGEPWVIQDAQADPRTAGVRGSYEATEIRAVICVSLLKAGRFVAAMAVHHATPRAWQPAEIELVQLVANRCWESIERARVMRVLAESEQHLRLAVETARLGSFELDLQTDVMTCSAQCKINYGVPGDRPFRGEDFWAAVHPRDRDRVRAAVEQAIAQRSGFELEYETVWPDNTDHWVLVRGHAGDRDPPRLIGVSLDITARKQAEQELSRLHDEAVRASRAKDDFLAALSHELRTPLNPVLLLASEAAQDRELPASAREAFEIIRRNVELEARLIDDLLDLTGIVRGKLVVRQQPSDVHPILREAGAALAAALEAKHLDLAFQLDAPQHRVAADPDRLQQVFLNLLRNAEKFTPDGGRVTVTSSLEGGRTLLIQVSDTGIGMTTAELVRAFGAFEQGDHAVPTGVRRYGGLGLGLAIARQLVELHGGSIQAHSAGRDQGSTFLVRLPLLEAATPEPAAPPSPARLPPLRTHGAAGRVLLVEDHAPTRQALRQLLRRRHYQVREAASLAEARALTEQETFDLVISDIGLPDGDGTSLMAELRDRFGLKGIALTGYGMDQDIARSHAAGFVSHLTKPVRVESLEAALVRVNGTAG